MPDVFREIVPDVGAKVWKSAKQSRQTINEVLNLHCDPDHEHSKAIFPDIKPGYWTDDHTDFDAGEIRNQE